MLINKFKELNLYHKLRFIVGLLHVISALIIVVVIFWAIFNTNDNLLFSTSVVIGGLIVNQIFYHIYRMLGFLEKMLNKKETPISENNIENLI